MVVFRWKASHQIIKLQVFLSIINGVLDTWIFTFLKTVGRWILHKMSLILLERHHRWKLVYPEPLYHLNYVHLVLQIFLNYVILSLFFEFRSTPFFFIATTAKMLYDYGKEILFWCILVRFSAQYGTLSLANVIMTFATLPFLIRIEIYCQSVGIRKVLILGQKEAD